MSGIVQQKSAVATGTSVSATFDNPVGGNLIIAALFTSSQQASSVTDTGAGQPYQIALDQLPQFGYLFEMFFYKIPNGGSYNSLTVTANLSGSDTAHLHIFEVAGGYDSTEQSGANYNGTNSLNGTVSHARDHARRLLRFGNVFGFLRFRCHLDAGRWIHCGSDNRRRPRRVQRGQGSYLSRRADGDRKPKLCKRDCFWNCNLLCQRRTSATSAAIVRNLPRLGPCCEQRAIRSAQFIPRNSEGRRQRSGRIEQPLSRPSR